MGRQSKLNLRSLGMLLAIFLTPTTFSWSALESSDDLIKLAQSPLAKAQDRIQAMDKLHSMPEPGLYPELIKIIKNLREPPVIRAHSMELLGQTSDPQIMKYLEGLVTDKTMDTKIRSAALYSFWKQKGNEAQPLLINLIQDAGQISELRVNAINYLGTLSKQMQTSFWTEIATNKQNPDGVRLSAINQAANQNELKNHPELLTQIIRNPEESTELRKSALLFAEGGLPPHEVSRYLIEIISERKNAIDIRRFALHYFDGHPDLSFKLDLEQILSQERNFMLSDEIYQVIQNLELLASQKKQNPA